MQIAYYDYDKVAPFIILIKPTSFEEQIRVIDHLEEYITRKFALIVFDTITTLYRAEFESPKPIFALNRELNRQVALITQIVKTQKVASLITSQVRNVFNREKTNMEPVANRVLRFWSDVVLNLTKTGQTRIIKVLLEKHPKQKRSLNCYVKIERTGIRNYKN